ncbi:MAG: hypothetical protein A3J69_02450 [Candidatus Levybacteria bacterium RIFCSPHIGHO2_02_FULL_42_12]|nr:MAG: hypothetical protein A3J69_02450 [Candidatus Levybacteria bacterium RIFCSPHIGHO2_02_FULL_42_12]OGH42805.1 MAG: hypothetical protein A3B53_01685 [Candidatus Levybacteria bacterium RIFCSPLOWO2_01_FULL_42_15]
MSKSNILVIGCIVGAYLFFASVSYLIFSKTAIGGSLVLESKPPATSVSIFNERLPKTESCPLNGALYSKDQRKWWETHRPLGVMIENHKGARPQSGIWGADVVYEAVAEGGITRFLAMYHCQDAGQIGPVRSARTYFLDFISEYSEFPLYAHVGGANTSGPADALSHIADYEWSGYNDLNQFSIGFPTFWRDYNRLGRPTDTEHTMYSTVKKLWDFAKTRGLTNVDKDNTSWDESFTPYSFKDDIKVSSPQAQIIRLAFWENNDPYDVEWTYSAQTNAYERSHGGSPHVDKNNNKRIIAKNVVVLFMKERSANDGYEGNVHLLYTTKGTGSAIVFIDGDRIDATWRKEGRRGRTLLFTKQGKPIALNRGIIWFEILPTDGIVETE